MKRNSLDVVLNALNLEPCNDLYFFSYDEEKQVNGSSVRIKERLNQDCRYAVSFNLAALLYSRKIYFGIGSTVIRSSIVKINNLKFAAFKQGADNHFFRSVVLFAERSSSYRTKIFTYMRRPLTASAHRSMVHGVPHALLAIQDTYAILKSGPVAHANLFRNLDYAYALELLNFILHSKCQNKIQVVTDGLRYLSSHSLFEQEAFSMVKPFRYICLNIVLSFPQLFVLLSWQKRGVA